MAHRLMEFVVGLLFGIGLIVAGMTDPAKVQGFLDLAGNWDPSLAFVMGGAILVGIGAFFVARKRTTAFLGGAMQLPTARHIDKRLVIGSLMFGAGWVWPVSALGPPSCRRALASPRPSCSSLRWWQAWPFLNGWNRAAPRKPELDSSP